ncbi:hypothetical protein HG535_0D05930 [Zygotorulaspora mrakii]|uniref:DUF788 domain protein n=1 Tax=Zygotorulaspora mrakii TaxID=42260 RepID=A0A7H9B3A8_ZYGMR|nr:uncharacterized protein HG535_0D05930 [Zygotorulaspora mrakii]QLG72884.1 hypothetical protein HG535_0D05930 [Zygotorulaspora mrakii]
MACRRCRTAGERWIVRVVTMAGQAGKKQALSNSAALQSLYRVTVPIVILALLRSWASSGIKLGQLIKFALLHVPLIGCCYVLDKSGRPLYDAKGKIVKEGMDLSQAGGLTEYMFDVIYLSLFGDAGQILFNTRKLWYILLVVPAYAAYKLYHLKDQFMGNGGNGSGIPKGGAAAVNEDKSKRQAKREKRGDKNKVRYR